MATVVPSQEQQQAIDCPDHMVVVARPGSGKTFVVSHKVRKRVGTLPLHQGIIAISFTNKASDELARRCKADAFDVKRSFFGTLDDFCLREIIYPFARQVFPMDLDARTAKVRELPNDLTDLLPQTEPLAAAHADTSAFLPFLKASLSRGWVPLELVGMLACHVFDQSVACRRYFVARYVGVFIDEYQDTGHFQHALFLRLKDLGLTAVAVGDGDQSIYGFAHKDPRYLLALTAPASGFACFSITTNHRSHPSINDFALRLLNANHPMSSSGFGRVGIKHVDGDQRAIGQWLNKAIPRLMASIKIEAAGQVAVLCRHQHSARQIASALTLPWHVFEDLPFKDAPADEANVFADLLRLRCDPQLTAEALIEQARTLNLTTAARRTLRQAIGLCRTCARGELMAAVRDAATALLGRVPSAIGRSELQAVCEDDGLLQRFTGPNRNAVQIMTLHKAKGLEFDLVFHADLYDHVMPARDYSGPRGQVVFKHEQQCLNLHYVGVTRAIKACILLTSTARLNRSGELKAGAPSQFIGRNGAVASTLQW